MVRPVGRQIGPLVSPAEPGSLQIAVQHPWTGNVRELEHAVERGVVMADGECIEPEDMGLITNSSPELQLSVVALSNRPSGQVNSGPDMAPADGELSLEDYFMRQAEHQTHERDRTRPEAGHQSKVSVGAQAAVHLPRSQTGKRRRS